MNNLKDLDKLIKDNRIITDHKTTHLAEAATYKYMGYRIVTINSLGHGRGEFVFENLKKSDYDMYHTGSALIEPGLFATLLSQVTRAAKGVGNI